MLSAVIDFSLRHRAIVIFAALAIVIAGGIAVQHMDVDAFPDTTPVQVQINTVVPSLGPEEVETQITFPIEQAISGLPKLQSLRSISKFGLSQVVVIFEDGVNSVRHGICAGILHGTDDCQAGRRRKSWRADRSRTSRTKTLPG